MLAVLMVFRRWPVSDFDGKAWITPGETPMNTLTKPSAQTPVGMPCHVAFAAIGTKTYTGLYFSVEQSVELSSLL